MSCTKSTSSIRASTLQYNGKKTNNVFCQEGYVIQGPIILITRRKIGQLITHFQTTQNKPMEKMKIKDTIRFCTIGILSD